MTIYGDLILDHYQKPRNNHRLNHPSAAIDVYNLLCGDKLHMEIKINGDKVDDIGFTGEGCAISIASASLLTQYAKGRNAKTLVELSSDNVLKLLNIELSPNRAKCALLSWEALIKLMRIVFPK